MDAKRWTFIALLLALANAEFQQGEVNFTVQPQITANLSEPSKYAGYNIQEVNATKIYDAGNNSWNFTEYHNATNPSEFPENVGNEIASNATSNETAFELIMAANSKIGELPCYCLRIFRKVHNLYMFRFQNH